jgi:hypothetical protein
MGVLRVGVFEIAEGNLLALFLALEVSLSQAAEVGDALS